jgi:hypothetical protein
MNLFNGAIFEALDYLDDLFFLRNGRVFFPRFETCDFFKPKREKGLSNIGTNLHFKPISFQDHSEKCEAGSKDFLNQVFI